MKKLDLVIPYIACYSSELDWSLRSLDNLEHKDVYIIGDRPNFEGDFTVIQHEPNDYAGISPTHDVISKIKIACELDISDDVILSSDDTFAMKPIKAQNYNRGTIQDHIAERSKVDAYNFMLLHSLAWLQRYELPTLSYELHTFFVFNRAKMLKLINKIEPMIRNDRALLIRSLYGNSYGIESTKIADTKNPADFKGREILSTNEGSFTTGEIGEYIRANL